MNAIPTTAALVPNTIGAPFEGGFYGGQIRIGDTLAAIVWAPKAQGQTKAAWLDRYDNVPGARSCFDSLSNTRAMAAAGSAIAQWALALDINGHTDWCVPARDVLELAYRHLKPTTYENCCSFRDGDNASSVPVGYPYTEALPAQTTAEAFHADGAEAFDDTWYWSSTQFSDSDAFRQNFNYGNQGLSGKKYEARCRAVRLIQLSA